MKRIGGRITDDSYDAWYEIHERYGASISSLLEVAGPHWLRLLDADDPRALDLIAMALRVQAERSRRF